MGQGPAPGTVYKRPDPPKEWTGRKGMPSEDLDDPGAATIDRPVADDPFAIQADPAQIRLQATEFEAFAAKIAKALEHIRAMAVHAGYFEEAQTVEKMVVAFQTAFGQNLNNLQSACLMVRDCLNLVATDFENGERSRLGANTDLSSAVQTLSGFVATIGDVTTTNGQPTPPT